MNMVKTDNVITLKLIFHIYTHVYKRLFSLTNMKIYEEDNFQNNIITY